MPRIVSLLPSATEWVHLLGLQDDLVGVTFECDTPATARVGRAVVVGGLDTAGLGPAQIDARVRAAVAAGEALYTLDEAAMAALAPDVVLTQDLCRVCALPAQEAREAVRRAGCPGTVVTLDPHTLAGVLDGVLDVGAACGVPERAARARARLGQRLDDVSAALAGTAGGGRTRPRVLVLEWSDPPFVAGHWVPDLVTAAGGEPVDAVPGGRSVTTTWEEVAACAADVVLVAPCGLGLPDALAQARALLPRLPARAAVYAVDAGGLVTRPGPRVVDAVEALAALWHPDAGLPQHPDRARAVR